MLNNPRFLLIFLVTLLVGFVSYAHAMNEENELLPESEAFSFSAELLPDNNIAVRWEIADGYYMYRDKMDFQVVGDAAFAKPVVLPDGKMKSDPLFGDVQVYTGQLEMALLLKEGYSVFTLVALGQGCNEPIGVCYPPMRQEIVLQPGISNASAVNTSDPLFFPPPGSSGLIDPAPTLADTLQLAASDNSNPDASVTATESDPAVEQQPAPDTAVAVTVPKQESPRQESASENPGSVELLRSLLDGGIEQSEFLPVDEAFKLDLTLEDSSTIRASFVVADGYYLYRDKLSFSASGDARIGETNLPPAIDKQDEYFGLTPVYTSDFTVPLSLLRNQPGSGELTVEVGYQGCAEGGICYAPEQRSFTLSLPAVIDTAAAQEADLANTAAPGVQSDAGDDKTLWRLLLGSLAAGLLLTLTPCVLPMIPILAGVIAGQGARLTRMRGGVLALFYVMGTAVTYAAMGALAGATGDQLQAYFQNPWAIGFLAAVFVLMAMSMFGLYNLQMPAAIQSRLQSSTGRLGGSVPLVFILGLVSALIIGACVSPILISFLGIAVSRADPVLGAQMMFVMAVGMGLPLILLGFGAGYLLPRAGAWMETIKQFFGIMLLAVAIYLLGALPSVPVLLLWGVLLVVVSIYMGATQSLAAGSSGWQRLEKGIGTVLLVWGIAALIGGLYGERNLLRPLPTQLIQGHSASIQQDSAPAPLFSRVSNLEQVEQHFAAADAAGKRVMLDFYADWCVECIRMEETTFHDARITQVIRDDYLALQVDVTDPGDQDSKAIKNHFGVFGPPAMLFFDANGSSLTEKNFYGYRAPDEFLKLISD